MLLFKTKSERIAIHRSESPGFKAWLDAIDNRMLRIDLGTWHVTVWLGRMTDCDFGCDAMY
jgi:hypothetical protein